MGEWAVRGGPRRGYGAGSSMDDVLSVLNRGLQSLVVAIPVHEN